MNKMMNALIAGLMVMGVASVAQAAGDAEHPKQIDWSFEGPFGHYDRASAQRGFQIYREVCSACHSLKYVAFRNLTEIGFSEEQVKALAAEYVVMDGPDDMGDMFERPGQPSDRIPSPFANDNAARAANGGALPPDLSLMAKARMDGPNYLYSLLTGYEEGHDVPAGMNYNKYFPGQQIAMAAPLFDDRVEYTDGTTASLEQMSMDVTQFLMWAAEPKLEDRHRIGYKVIFFLVILTVLLYFSNKKVWAGVKGRKD